jgi:CrcB protein
MAILAGMGQVTLIAVAGAAGTLCRHALTVWTYRVWGPAFPWGTLLSNVLGCLVIGAFFGLWKTSASIPDTWRLPIAVGFCGGFTTLSSFAYETLRYLEGRAWGTAMLNVAANVILGLLAVWGAMAAARALAA